MSLEVPQGEIHCLHLSLEPFSPYGTALIFPHYRPQLSGQGRKSPGRKPRHPPHRGTRHSSDRTHTLTPSSLRTLTLAFRRPGGCVCLRPDPCNCTKPAEDAAPSSPLPGDLVDNPEVPAVSTALRKATVPRPSWKNRAGKSWASARAQDAQSSQDVKVLLTGPGSRPLRSEFCLLVAPGAKTVH